MRYVLALLSFLFCSVSYAQDALVVQTCGTLPLQYSAGATRQLTVDVNGRMCGLGGVSQSGVFTAGDLIVGANTASIQDASSRSNPGTLTGGALTGDVGYAYSSGLITDNANANTNNLNPVVGLYERLNITTGATGNHTAILGQVRIATAPTTAGQYVGLWGYANATVNAGGTSGAGNGRGNLFGANPQSLLATGGTFWSSVVGAEIDVGIQTGASAEAKIGLNIVDLGNSVVSGSSTDAALLIGNSSTSNGFLNGILFSNYNNGTTPVQSSGSILSTTAFTVTHGIDLSNLTCSSDCFKGPSFSVTGAGAIAGANINVTGSTAPTNGMYLPGANTLGFSQNGSGTVFILSAGSLSFFSQTLINGSDIISISGNGAGNVAQTIKNANAGTASTVMYRLANANSNAQATITLNSSGFSGGQGANALQITNTGAAPIVIGTGTEVIKFGTSGAFSANGSVATAMSSLGPVGSHATIQKWLTITDSGGTVGYIPVF